jgi:hypothetical protein
MNDVDMEDSDLVSRLRRLDSAGAGLEPGFDYQGLLDRHARRKANTRRRAIAARGVAGALVVAMIGVSAWHLGRTVDDEGSPTASRLTPSEAIEISSAEYPEQRLVRADTWLALAAIEEHIASIDDALTDARANAPHGMDVARLERARAELLDSYAHVRYADMVAVNF